AAHGYSRVGERREDADMCGPECCALLEHRRPFADVLPPITKVPSGVSRVVDGDPVIGKGRRVLLPDDAVTTFGQGRPGKDAGTFTRPQRFGGKRTGGNGLHDSQDYRSL